MVKLFLRLNLLIKEIPSTFLDLVGKKLSRKNMQIRSFSGQYFLVLVLISKLIFSQNTEKYGHE